MATSSKNDHAFRIIAESFKLCVISESYQRDAKSADVNSQLQSLCVTRNLARCCRFVADQYDLSWKESNKVILFWKNHSQDSNQIPSISAHDFATMSNSISTVLGTFLNPTKSKGNWTRKNVTDFLKHLSPQEISAAKSANGLSTKNLNKETLHSLTKVLADAAFSSYQSDVFQASVFLKKENEPRLASRDGVLGIEISMNSGAQFKPLNLPTGQASPQNVYNDDFPTLQDAVKKLNEIKPIFAYEESLANNPVCLYGEAYASPESIFRNIASLYNLQIKNQGTKSKIKPPAPNTNIEFSKILSSIHALIPNPLQRDCKYEAPCIVNARNFLRENSKSLQLWLKQKKTLYQLPILFQTCIAISLCAMFIGELAQRMSRQSSVIYDRFWEIQIKISRNGDSLVLEAFTPNKKTGKLDSVMSWEAVNYKAPWER